MKLLIAAAVLAAVPAFAEDAPDDAANERVRARLRSRDGSERWVTGRFLGADESSVTIQPAKGEPVVLELARVDRLDRSLGRRDASDGFFRGAGIGFVAGAATGVLWGLAAGNGSDGWISPSGAALFGGTVLGGSGAVVGGFLGAAVRQERWQRTEPGAVRISVAPARGGLGGTVRLSF